MFKNPLIRAVYEDFSNTQKDFIDLKFLKKNSKSPVLVSKKTGTVFHNEVISNEDNLLFFNKVFSNKIDLINQKYTSFNPIMNSRHYYGVKFLQEFLTLKKLKKQSLNICDFGAGEGQFSLLLKKEKEFQGCYVILTEYSKSNTNLIKKNFKNQNIDIHKLFNGSIEDFNKVENIDTIDIGVLNWTLCNCVNPINVLNSIHNSLKKKGLLMIGESSRLLVPFKKVINNYFNSKFKSFLHPWHFSYNSLSNLLEICNFRIVYSNRYYDENDMFVIAKKIDKKYHKPLIRIDNYINVINFFKRWKKESSILIKNSKNFK